MQIIIIFALYRIYFALTRLIYVLIPNRTKNRPYKVRTSDITGVFTISVMNTTCAAKSHNAVYKLEVRKAPHTQFANLQIGAVTEQVPVNTPGLSLL